MRPFWAIFTSMDEETRENGNTAPKAPSSTTPFVLGLLSFLTAYFLPPVSLVLGIIGIVKANKFKRLEISDGKSDAGWILSLLGIIFSVMCLLAFLRFFGPFLWVKPVVRYMRWIY